MFTNPVFGPVDPRSAPPREPVQREPFTPLLGRAPFLGDCNAAEEGRAAT